MIRNYLITSLLCISSQAFSAPKEENNRPPEQDRKAILAMAGEFGVQFNFEETVALQPGYKIKEEYNEDAKEMVIVIEDSGNRIVLQHILSDSGRVVKHWKQIWTWQDDKITQFLGNNRWRVQDIPAEKSKGRWTQQVMQVDDSPRYESLGVWSHKNGYSRWVSHKTPRPLPRREHTKRSDYQVLLAVNEHAITPAGWVHHQDNLKLVLEAEGNKPHFLAREEGINYYDKISDGDFDAAKQYWERTHDFWALVSEIWEDIQNRTANFRITKEIDGKSLVKTLFETAKAINDGTGEIPDKAAIKAMITDYVKVAQQ